MGGGFFCWLVRLSVAPATLEQLFDYWRGGHGMATTTPPTRKITTPDMEVATLGDLLDLSHSTGIPACGLYGVMKEDARVEVQRGCDCLDVR